MNFDRNGRSRLIRPHLPLGGLFLFLAASLSGGPRPQAAVPPNAAVPPAAALVHSALTGFRSGDKIRITATAAPGTAGVAFYFRTTDVDAFQARPMIKSGGSEYVFEFDTSLLTAARFEYYIESELGGAKTAVPAGAPAQTIGVSASDGEAPPVIPQNLPSPQAEEARFPVHANGSLQHNFSPSQAAPAPAAPSNPSDSPAESLSGLTAPPPAAPAAGQNGNIQVAFGSQPSSGPGLMIAANAGLTQNPLPGAGRVDLSNMNVAVFLGRHVLRAGDLNINESEFSAFGFGRRGFEYAFDNRKLYLHAFDVNTQQLLGFKGLGIPKSGSTLLGAAAGFSLFQEAFTMRAIALTGRDDPAQAAAVGGSQILQKREGNVLALTQETKLFGSALDLKAEFAHSSYDQNLSDTAGRLSGSAWSAGGTLNLGPLTLGAIYRSIGRDYNSIGLQYLANDRRGWDSNLLLGLGAISIQGQFTLQSDNVAADPERPTTTGRGGSLAVNWTLCPALSLMAGYRINDQKTASGTVETPGQDTSANESTAGLNLTLSSAISLNLAVTDSILRSVSSPSGDVSGRTINLGGSFRAGQWLTLMPTFGLTRSKTRLSGEVNTTFSAMVSGEIFFLPRVLSLLLSGSFNRMEMSVLSLTKTLDVMGGINFYLGSLIHVNNLLLSVRGSHRTNDMSGARVKDTRILAQTDFAF
jgi:hypothetical protein